MRLDAIHDITDMNIRTFALAVSAAAVISVPVHARPAPPPACGAGDLSGGTFLACSGYSAGNYIAGSSTKMAFADAKLTELGLVDSDGVWLEKVDSLGGGHTIDFATSLTGIVYLGIHKGGGGDGGQGTAWYKIDFGSVPVDSFTYNLNGLSNAALYAVEPPPVPEPQAVALFLAGLAAIGFVAGRRRRSLH
jgi:PEP-CTERM motif